MLLQQDALEEAEGLADIGVSSSRIQELAQNGIDIKKHHKGIYTIQNSRYTVTARGDVGEVLATRTVLPEYLEPGEKIVPLEPQKGVEINFDSGGSMEIDHLIMNSDGEITKMLETKIGTESAQARGQINNDLRDITYAKDNNYMITSSLPEGISLDQFKF